MWTITRLKNLRDVYVERYLFSIFVVVKVPKLPINEYKIINQYRLTYTPFRLKILNFIRECLQVFIKT